MSTICVLQIFEESVQVFGKTSNAYLLQAIVLKVYDNLLCLCQKGVGLELLQVVLFIALIEHSISSLVVFIALLSDFCLAPLECLLDRLGHAASPRGKPKTQEVENDYGHEHFD